VLTPLAKVLRKRLPSMKTTRQITEACDATDWFGIYRQVKGPLLVFNATADEARPRMVKMIGEEGLRMMRAYRNGLRRDLAALSAEHSNIAVTEIDATHMLISSHPVEVAQRMLSFLADPARRR
jgi:hypothetical protein